MNPDDEIGRLLASRRGPSKSKMEEDLRRAVLNTGGTPVAKPTSAKNAQVRTPEPVSKPTVIADSARSLKPKAPAPFVSKGLERSTTFAPKFEELTLPTADHIAWAVVSAAREFGVSPIALMQARKNNDPGDGLPIKRARVIAAFALAEAFPDMPRTAIGRVLGSEHKSWYRNCEVRFMQNRPWPPGAIERAVRAIKDHSK